MPASSATDRVVVKDSTSTTTKAAAPAAIAVAPCSPQSKRMLNPDWLYGSVDPCGCGHRHAATSCPLSTACQSDQAGAQPRRAGDRANGAGATLPLPNSLALRLAGRSSADWNSSRSSNPGSSSSRSTTVRPGATADMPGPRSALRRAGVFGPDLPRALQPFHPLLPDGGLDPHLTTQVGRGSPTSSAQLTAAPNHSQLIRTGTRQR